jgi:vitamin B12 transporter
MDGCMFLRVSFILLIVSFFSITSYSKEIPTIVISASKKPQSISTVGTSVTVLEEDFFNNSTEYFLGDALSNNITSANFFQSGGHGTASAIQLRGLPKRYSTVYIDGVKMSDPSSVSNDFDFNHILTGNISRVEILKGNQSSIYGSGAIGGTINITTKKGKPGFHKDVNYMTGSHGTHNLSTSLSGADEKNNFFVGLERFQTDGISAMMHNNEKDRYRNNSLVVNYGHILSDKLEFTTNTRIAETYLQYDAEAKGKANNEEQDTLETSSNIALVYEPMENFTNKFTVASTYIKRIYAASPGSFNTSKDNYYGDRYSFMYSGNYDFNLDTSVAFGSEREEDEMGFNENTTGRVDRNSMVTSNYYDFQRRFPNDIYLTLGSRFDEHERAGTEDSHRFTMAQLFDNKTTKYKFSYGTGFRFPSLYEEFYVYASNANSLPFVKAENSKSWDFGIEKNFLDRNLKIDLTYFNASYTDVLEGWKSGTSGSGTYTSQNMPGEVKSQGIEFISEWIKSDFLKFGLNYTYTSTYDGAEQDDPDANSNYHNAQMVRVPRNILNLITTVKFPNYKNLNLTLHTKWSDTARDYGNGNRTFTDEETDDYIVNDLSANYILGNKYKLYVNVTNIFDEKYETVRDYNQMDRSFNFGLKQQF